MQQQLIEKKEKAAAPIVEELESTSLATLRCNMAASASSTIHGTTDQEWSAQRKKHSSKKGTQSKIVPETQDQGQIAQGTSQRQVVSTKLVGNMAIVYFVQEVQKIDDLIPK
ncbi:hypothetical protein AMTRI_Chr03g142660 [Amborella trichopoda]